MKLGILGGTFNPIHLGHLAMAEAVRGAHHLDRVILVPSARPPHKSSADLASPQDRLEMARLAAASRPGLEVDALELERPGPSYTVDTLEELTRRHPGAELYFIIGEDSIPELPTWRNTRRILELARIVAVNRPGRTARFDPESFPGTPRSVVERMERDRVTMEPAPQESRRIREAVRRGQDVSGEVPAGVAAYIASRGLYRQS